MEETPEKMDEVQLDPPAAEAPKKRRGNPNLAAAREKAAETRRQQGLINKAKKVAAKAEHAAKLEEALKILEPKEAPKEKPKKKAKKIKTIEISDSSSDESSDDSDEEDSSDEEEEEIVKVVRRPKSAKASKKPKAAVKPRKPRAPPNDEELGGQVARDILRQRVLQKAADDAIRRLVPGYRGFS